MSETLDLLKGAKSFARPTHKRPARPLYERPFPCLELSRSTERAIGQQPAQMT